MTRNLKRVPSATDDSPSSAAAIDRGGARALEIGAVADEREVDLFVVGAIA